MQTAFLTHRTASDHGYQPRRRPPTSSSVKRPAHRSMRLTPRLRASNSREGGTASSWTNNRRTSMSMTLSRRDTTTRNTASRGVMWESAEPQKTIKMQAGDMTLVSDTDVTLEKKACSNEYERNNPGRRSGRGEKSIPWGSASTSSWTGGGLQGDRYPLRPFTRFANVPPRCPSRRKTKLPTSLDVEISDGRKHPSIATPRQWTLSAWKEVLEGCHLWKRK